MTRSPTVRSKPKLESTDNVVILTFRKGSARPEGDMIAGELATLSGDIGQKHLLLDCSNLTYINSLELGTLIALHKKMKASGGRLTLFNVNHEIYEVFEVTRLHSLLAICREHLQDTPVACSPS